MEEQTKHLTSSVWGLGEHEGDNIGHSHDSPLIRLLRAPGVGAQEELPGHRGLGVVELRDLPRTVGGRMKSLLRDEHGHGYMGPEILWIFGAMIILAGGVLFGLYHLVKWIFW